MSALPPAPYTSTMCDGRVRAADGQCIAQVFERDGADAGESLRLMSAVVGLPGLLERLDQAEREAAALKSQRDHECERANRFYRFCVSNPDVMQRFLADEEAEIARAAS